MFDKEIKINKILFYFQRIFRVVVIFLPAVGLLKTAQAYTLDEQNKEAAEKALLESAQDPNQEFGFDDWSLHNTINRLIKNEIAPQLLLPNAPFDLGAIVIALECLEEKKESVWGETPPPSSPGSRPLPDIPYVENLGKTSSQIYYSMPTIRNTIAIPTLDITKHVLLRLQLLKIKKLLAASAESNCSLIDHYVLLLSRGIQTAIIDHWQHLPKTAQNGNTLQNSNALVQGSPMAQNISSFVWESCTAKKSILEIPKQCRSDLIKKHLKTLTKRLNKVGINLSCPVINTGS